ncbi:hypothetical protein HZC09_06460 [Candidatus Micrarchaeota archaeon]|nr:hypothetical protein [Candidatus Micrarchaeota archaeon]
MIVEKVHPDETSYGIVRKYSVKEAGEKLRGLCEKREKRMNSLRQKHRAMVVDFHSTPYTMMGEAKSRTPEQFRLMEQIGSPIVEQNAEITVSGYLPEYVVEVPAAYVPLPEAVVKKYGKKIDRIRYTDVFTVWRDLLVDYQLKHTRLNIPEQEKYKSPIISMLIAKSIHKHLIELDAKKLGRA